MTEKETIKNLMKRLECTEEEAKDIIKTDYIIDHGGRTPYDLDPTLEKEIKKLINVTDRKSKDPNNQRGKTQRVQPGKAEIIKFLADSLKNAGYSDILIENPTKIITFSAKIVDEKTKEDKILNFKLDLTATRAKKK